MNSYNILTNDPSICAWGWAVITLEGRILEKGCVKTEPDTKKKNLRKTDDRFRRITEINRVLLAAIIKHDVKYITSEAPHGSQSAVAAVMIGMTAGMIQTIADTLDIPIEHYSEGEVKKFMLSKRAAVKNEMIQAVRERISVHFTGTKYIDEAVADALGVYLTAMASSPTLKAMKQIKMK